MIRPEEIDSPRVIDVNRSGECNLFCPGCWGPLHDIGLQFGLDDWKLIASKFREVGTVGAIVTGGEPLIHEDTPDFVRHLNGIGFHTTVSHNGMYPDRLRQVMPYVTEIGIPLDGSTPELNARIRRPGKDHYHLAIDAMNIAREVNPEAHLTVRTWVSRVNLEDIIKIGDVVSKLESAPNRWKLYQYAPTGGYGQEAASSYGIERGRFDLVVDEVRSEFPDLNIDTLTHDKRAGRYVFIMPDADVSAVSSDGLTYVHLGNALENFQEVLENFAKNAITESHLTHGLLY